MYPDNKKMPRHPFMQLYSRTIPLDEPKTPCLRRIQSYPDLESVSEHPLWRIRLRFLLRDMFDNCFSVFKSPKSWFVPISKPASQPSQPASEPQT